MGFFRRLRRAFAATFRPTRRTSYTDAVPAATLGGVAATQPPPSAGGIC